MTEIRLNPDEVRVLAALASIDGDFGFLGFKDIAYRVRLNRPAIRRACRSLARKGLAEFARGLWTEDGEVAGSGYAATEVGRLLADKRRVERIELRMGP